MAELSEPHLMTLKERIEQRRIEDEASAAEKTEKLRRAGEIATALIDQANDLAKESEVTDLRSSRDKLKVVFERYRRHLVIVVAGDNEYQIGRGVDNKNVTSRAVDRAGMLDEVADFVRSDWRG